MAQEIDNLQIIQGELQRFGGWQKAAANSFVMVQCPFHDDNGPSCGVYTSYTPYRHYTLGDFNCFGCGAHGPWNDFADKAKLQKIKAWASKEAHAANRVTKEIQSSLLGQDTTTLKSLFKKMDVPEAQKWPADMPWRSYSGDLLSDVGAYIASDHRNSSVCIVFPIRIGGKIRGGVKGVYERKEKQLGYVTSEGSWVKQYGLLGFELAKKLIKENRARFIILCEGPRDALRLLSMGIPACAILGANNYSQQKAQILTSLGLDMIYVMPDNDNGGTKMWNTIDKVHTRLGIPTKRIKLPRKKNKQGELIKMDPGNMSISIARDLARFLKDTHAEFRFRTLYIGDRQVRSTSSVSFETRPIGRMEFSEDEYE